METPTSPKIAVPTIRKLTLDQLEVPYFSDAQLEFLKNCIAFYEQDILAINPMEYAPHQLFTALHIDWVSYKASMDSLQFVLDMQEALKIQEQELRVRGVKVDIPEALAKAGSSESTQLPHARMF
jgi:hypothetical protein